MRLKSNYLQISCDGGASTGKSTGAKMISKKFNQLKYQKLEKINLHTQEISEASAKIAKVNNVRKILKKYQLTFVKKYPNCCIEGRDISTKIMPNS